MGKIVDITEYKQKKSQRTEDTEQTAWEGFTSLLEFVIQELSPLSEFVTILIKDDLAVMIDEDNKPVFRVPAKTVDDFNFVFEKLMERLPRNVLISANTNHKLLQGIRKVFGNRCEVRPYNPQEWMK
jgi:hypothetical protein